MYNVNLNLQTTLSIAYIILLLYIISNYVAILIYSCVIIVINYGTLMEQSSEGHTSFNTGALVRGFLVFVGLSILVIYDRYQFNGFCIALIGRLSKTRAQLVRKYGVLTHRQDVEMRPLPLEEEDDEDTTVFDASNVVTINAQHQNT